MKILVTGKYEQAYNRNHVLLRGLDKLGIELIEFPYLKRNKNVKDRIRVLSYDCDFVFLPSFTHLDVPFVRKLTSKPILFDPLISRYLSKVFDYKAVWKYSPRALKNYLKDSRAFKYSDLIFADTLSHKKYFIDRFDVDPAKIVVLRIGVDTDYFFPTLAEKNSGEKIIVGFYGSFIPLHGLEKIIIAAKLLEQRMDIEFQIYGHGPGYSQIQNLILKLGLKNVHLKGWIEYSSLNAAINNMDICLGIFGDSLKAELVIPNKIYHYAACRKPIITADTKGINEIFKNGENIALVKNDPSSIAKTIENLTENIELTKKIAANAYELVTTSYNEKMIAAEFLNNARLIIPAGNI